MELPEAFVANGPGRQGAVLSPNISYVCQCIKYVASAATGDRGTRNEEGGMGGGCARAAQARGGRCWC